MDGRGRPVKEDERLSARPVVQQRDDEELQNAGEGGGFEGVREAQGARRPSTTMGADSSALHLAEQMASLGGREEQEEMLFLQEQQRRRNGQRRGSRTNLEEVIEYNISSSMQQQQQQQQQAASFIYALQQQRQQQQTQMQQQMTAGGLKTFPSSAAPAPPATFVDWSSQLPHDMIDPSYEPPAEPERPIAARGRRPSIGQLF